MRHSLRIAPITALAGGLLLGAGAASAAPQVLGLVASIRPTPMHCDAQGCRADLSSFCLQQPRPYPHLGTVYDPAPGTKLTLVVTGHDGQVRRLDAGRYLAFVDDSGFASVTARLSAATLASLDAASIAVEVGKDASLLPVAKAADLDPQSGQEIALATGTTRQNAETFFDRPGRDADAIRLTNAMINYLPPGELGKNAADADVLADRGRLSWRPHRSGGRSPSRGHSPQLRGQGRRRASDREHAQLPGRQPRHPPDPYQHRLLELAGRVVRYEPRSGRRTPLRSSTGRMRRRGRKLHRWRSSKSSPAPCGPIPDRPAT
jgi:hypothetical protein